MRALLIASAVVAAAAQCQPDTCGQGNPPRFTLPDSYQAYVQFSIPYYNFSEKVYVWGTTRNGGAMKLQYGAGAATFIYNNMTQMSYSLYAAEQSLLCSATQFSGFNTPWPDLGNFCRSNNARGCPVSTSVNGVPAHMFEFKFSDVQANPNSDSDFNPPNNVGPGYVGWYRWYQDAATGLPLRFHTIVGHNVVFGGSHVDEYVVDYLYFAPAPMWPAEEFFSPPYGMPCSQSSNPFGPTKSHEQHKASLKTFGRDEPTDFHSLFPEGHVHRRAIADAHADVHSKILNGKRHNNHQLAWLHTSARYIHARNRQLRIQGGNYTLGLNAMAHLSHEERRSRSKGFRATGHTATAADFARVLKETGKPLRPLGLDQPADECTYHQMSGQQLPSSVDNSMYTFPPKDQGTCGSCWSFGSTGAIEGALWKANGVAPKKASQQNLMDCTWYYGNAACGGGNDYTAYSWLIAKNGGKIATEEMYGPYLNKNGFCHFDLSNNWTSGDTSDVLQIGGCVHVNNAFQGNGPTDGSLTPSLRDAIYVKGRPISVAIDATQPDFYYYTGGYYYDPACGNGLQDLDHEVLAVGYTTYNGEYYTRVKNSWSDLWGDGGFVWMSQKDNNCGVATSPNYILAPNEM